MATIVVSMALIIQATFFGDGGILAIGANCFNMAVVLPNVSYAIYQFLSAKQPVAQHSLVLAQVLAAHGGNHARMQVAFVQQAANLA